jgi:hypothetical protein
MATIKYCSYDTGNDSTGNGSASNPYKTITKASTGLTGGDEVRVAKSPDDTVLTGTLTFTGNSTAVTGSGTSFTTELAVSDYIKGYDGYYYEVTVITDNTHLTLYTKYASATQAGTTSYKMGVTSTGAAAAATTAIQTVSASGTSLAAPLTISGGWDLTGLSQTGVTNFRQAHATNRYGYGLYLVSKNFVSVSKVGFFRYRYGVYQSQGIGVSYTDCLFGGAPASYAGISTNASKRVSLVRCIAGSCLGYGIYPLYTDPFSMSACEAFSCNTGIYLMATGNGSIDDAVVSRCSSYGVNLQSVNALTCHNLTVSNCQTTGVQKSYGSVTVLCNVTTTGNAADFGISNATDQEKPALSIQHLNAAGTNQVVYEYGMSSRDTGTARSGECLRFAPTSATYYCAQSFYFAAASGVAQTLGAYVRNSAAFDGDVQGEVWFLGTKITGPTDITPSSDDTYESKTLNAAAVDITEDGVLELRIRVRGTAGYVYIDDLSAVAT